MATAQTVNPPSTSRAARVCKWLPPLAVALLLLLVRLPFVSNVLADEEGFFALMAVDVGQPDLHWKTSNVLLLSRLHGKGYFVPPEHPIVPYLLFRTLRPLAFWLKHSTSSFFAKTIAARIPFLLVFLVAMLLALHAGWSPGPTVNLTSRLTALAIVAYTATAPLLVGGSIQPQIDGSFGVLTTAITGWSLLESAKTPGTKVSFLLAAVAGFAAAIGKNEWTLAFLAAVISSLVFHVLVLRLLSPSYASPRSPGPAVTILPVLLGLALGSLFSYLLDPYDYKCGFFLIARIQSSVPSTDWWHVTRDRLYWIWPLAGLAFVSAWLAVNCPRAAILPPFPYLILLFWAVFLAAGFLTTPWVGDGFPRYFCPPATALLFLAIGCARCAEISRSRAWLFTVIAMSGLVLNLTVLDRFRTNRWTLTSGPFQQLAVREQAYENAHRNFLTSRRPIIIDTAFAYYFPGDDFIGSSLDSAAQQRFLANFESETPDRSVQ